MQSGGGSLLWNEGGFAGFLICHPMQHRGYRRVKGVEALGLRRGKKKKTFSFDFERKGVFAALGRK